MFENITDFIPSLVKNVELLEAQIEHITIHWISRPMVLDVMKKHDIDPELFKNEYAVKVLEYFFSVIKNENRVGDCPVIDKLLEYLKNKDISADELFIICTHARKAVIDEVFRQNIVSHQLISDIALLFDLNFSGVLKQYANTIYKLENKVKEELEKNREKDILLLQQSRMAQMGEMISMIAHQWRQPLGAIASTSIDLKMQSEFKVFDLKEAEGCKAYEEYINKGLGEIDNFVKSLTTTIDDFRNFHKPNKALVSVTLDELCKKALNIINGSLLNDSIEITSNYSSSKKIEVHDSEMIQVILNILKNSQDNFKDKAIINPSINITSSENSILVCDNGGGIPEEVLPKIFDPYYSTKNDKNGTGLGLYMSKTIIEDHHNGRLKVKNIDGGVCFIIELDVKKEGLKDE